MLNENNSCVTFQICIAFCSTTIYTKEKFAKIIPNNTVLYLILNNSTQAGLKVNSNAVLIAINMKYVADELNSMLAALKWNKVITCVIKTKAMFSQHCFTALIAKI